MSDKEELPFSNYVSISKYILLNICTLGFFELLWIYRQWRYIVNEFDLYYNPMKRAIFSSISFGTLVYFINKLNEQRRFKNIIISVIYGLIFSGFTFFCVLTENYIIILLSFLIPIPLLLRANKYYETNQSDFQIRKLKKWQYVFLLMGFILFCLLTLGVILS